MKIEPCSDETVLDQCAELMSRSEPFVSLKFTYGKCRVSVRGDYKEVYVVRNENKLAGFIVLQLYGPLRGYIQTICVEPEFRRKGIGTALLGFSEARLLKQFPNVFICVTSFNHDAQKLYYRLGYEKVGEFKDHIVRGADEYLLRKQGSPTSEFVAT